jgi:hypothetical protein
MIPALPDQMPRTTIKRRLAQEADMTIRIDFQRVVSGRTLAFARRFRRIDFGAYGPQTRTQGLRFPRPPVSDRRNSSTPTDDSDHDGYAGSFRLATL